MLQRLKELRAEYGVSQQKLADALQISQPSINKYENHNIEPDIDILKRMADYFNTSVDYIIGHTNVRTRIEDRDMPIADRTEIRYLNNFSRLTEAQKKSLNQMIEAFINEE